MGKCLVAVGVGVVVAVVVAVAVVVVVAVAVAVMRASEGSVHKHCHESICSCGIVALEPDPKCEDHGGERQRLRCDLCGQFMIATSQPTREGG